MSDNGKFSLVDFSAFAKPVEVLVQAITSAVGIWYEPHQMKRIARAKGEVSLIEFANQQKLSALESRAVNRIVVQESRAQNNIESIASQSLPLVKEDAHPEQLKSDWLSNFFDKAKHISDEQMQSAWAKVLAGEANTPGSFSRRAVNLLAEIDGADAFLFDTLCRFRVSFPEEYVIVSEVRNEIYNRHGINFASLTHLENLGLIAFSSLSSFLIQPDQNKLTAQYCDHKLDLTLFAMPIPELSVGRVMLSGPGSEIASLCVREEIPGFYEHLKHIWSAHLAHTDI
ncbi:DUF2806 domain-containing protein [Xylophilus sp. Leaf220]|uniref:DUF2806 domain-containing protein n=1 Tax=Xylophilus sp. Leaf220 TaxID=1735686 RepID=UPI0009E8C724|nr:DUF2806 domain-containing protein [Xylophilus sp. Leaf220]